MSTQHTQGRITFKEDGDANHWSMMTEDGRWWMALLVNGEQPSASQVDSFRRLAACWNACDGISTELLEAAPYKDSAAFMAYLKVEKERDELQASLHGAAKDVLAERQRQVSAEGWTPEHDDMHKGGQLSLAAACYTLAANRLTSQGEIPSIWPWAPSFWKPAYGRRDLVKAGALILAEIERMDRAAQNGGVA